MEAVDVTELQKRVNSIAWYHTFDLPGGVTTSGFYDHRRAAAKVPFPSLTGKRCLDAASSDGFWAFEMARRGAGSVVSLDLDDASRMDWQGPLRPELQSGGTGRAASAFEIVRDATGLDVERRDGSVYDLGPAEFGTFDFVFMGNVLLHLSDPARAMRAILSVTDGEFLSYETIALALSILYPRKPMAELWHTDEARWWTSNMAAHRRLVRAAGFEIVTAGGPLFQPFGALMPAWPSNVGPALKANGIKATAAYWLFVRRFGVPTHWVLARPK